MQAWDQVDQASRTLQGDFEFTAEDRTLEADFTYTAEAHCLPELHWNQPYRELQVRAALLKPCVV